MTAQIQAQRPVKRVLNLWAMCLMGLSATWAPAAEPTAQTNQFSWTGLATNAEGRTLATITADWSETPDLADWARRAGELCAQWYPKIAELLPSEGFQPPQRVRLRFRQDMRGVAATGRNTISVAAQYVRRNTNDWGMIIHELVHVVQAYPEPEPGYIKPGWLVEGIADYIRLAHFEPQARRPRINPDKARYTDSYKTTAIFLEWAERTYNHHLIRSLNQALRQGRFKLDLFKEITGKTVDELWQEFIATLRPKSNSNPTQ